MQKRAGIGLPNYKVERKHGRGGPHRSSQSSEMPKNWAMSFNVWMQGSMRPRS